MQWATELRQTVMHEAEKVFPKFRAVRPLTENVRGEMLPFLLSISARGQAADRVHHLMTLLTGSQAMRVIGVRMRAEKVQRQPLAQQIAKSLDATKVKKSDAKFCKSSWPTIAMFATLIP